MPPMPIARFSLPGYRAKLLQNPDFINRASKSGFHMLHNVMAIKIVISLVILIGAVVISALYSKTKKADLVAKKKLKFTSELWFGEQSGLVGTMIILWFPTLLFFIALRFVDFKALVE